MVAINIIFLKKKYILLLPEVLYCCFLLLFLNLSILWPIRGNFNVSNKISEISVVLEREKFFPT